MERLIALRLEGMNRNTHNQPEQKSLTGDSSDDVVSLA